MRGLGQPRGLVGEVKSVLGKGARRREASEPPLETGTGQGEQDGSADDGKAPPAAGAETPNVLDQAGEFRRLGREALAREDFQTAEERFRQAIELTPDEHLAWLWLARTQRRGGDNAASLASATRALSIKPGWPTAAEHVALLVTEGRAGEVVEVIRHARLHHDGELETLWHILRRLRTANALAEVAAVAEAMLRIDPTDERTLAASALTYSWLGQEAYYQADFRLAEERFLASVAVVDTYPWPWLWLARTQQRLGDHAGSIASTRRALDLRPDWPAALEHLAVLLASLGETDEAVDVLRRLALRHETDGEVLRRILWRLRRLNAHLEVARIAEAMLRLDPTDFGAMAAGAHALARLGATREAERLLESAAALPRGPKLTKAMVRYYLDDGKPREAWAALQCDEEYVPSPTTLSTLAQQLWRGGHLAEANRVFDLAAASAPDDEQLLARRRVLKSETAVLRGEWRPPALAARRSPAIPGQVLHVVGKSLPYNQAGYTIRTQSIARAQRQAGLDPRVVSQFGFPWNQGIEAPAEEAVDDIPYYRLTPGKGIPPAAEERLTRHALGLAGVVREARPAVLHAASDFHNALVALAVGEAYGIPVVYEVRGFWEETWLSRRDAESTDAEIYSLRRARELEAMTRSDRVVTLSEGMRAELVARGVPPAKIEIVPNAVDVDLFVPVERDVELAAKLGIAADEVVLGYISSLTHYEGVAYLLEAIGRLVANGHLVRGLIVGDGPEYAALVAHAARLGLADRVLFTGRVPHEDVLRYYGLIDVFVIPRTADRVSQLVTPLKPLEAMATGRVVVVSGVDALREMVVAGETGLVFEPEDAADLAAVVAPLIADETRRATLGRAARAWVCAHRTWEQNGRRYRDLYREMGVALPEE